MKEKRSQLTRIIKKEVCWERAGTKNKERNYARSLTARGESLVTYVRWEGSKLDNEENSNKWDETYIRLSQVSLTFLLFYRFYFLTSEYNDYNAEKMFSEMGFIV